MHVIMHSIQETNQKESVYSMNRFNNTTRFYHGIYNSDIRRYLIYNLSRIKEYSLVAPRLRGVLFSNIKPAAFIYFNNT
jgi:hypothetical protein